MPSLLSFVGYGAQAVAVLLLAHYGFVWVSLAAVLLPELVRWLIAGRTNSALLASAPRALMGVSVTLLIGLTPSATQTVAFAAPLAQIILAILYGAWLLWLETISPTSQRALVVVLVSQFMITCAVYQAQSVWHWQPGLVVTLMWFASFSNAAWYAYGRGEPSAGALSLAWALIAAEAAWVFAVWVVHYVILGGVLVIPQGALVITGLGYCLASVYIARSQRKLSRQRLIEYVVIMAALVAIVGIGTRWNVTG